MLRMNLLIFQMTLAFSIVNLNYDKNNTVFKFYFYILHSFSRCDSNSRKRPLAKKVSLKPTMTLKNTNEKKKLSEYSFSKEKYQT